MSSDVLRPACQLAFAVAREGAEAADVIDPPSSMRSFLYVEDLPRRALAAAQQVIEENSEFRHRVAMRAAEDEVGRAGYLWLHRPTGWAQEFESLAQDADDSWPSADGGEPDPMLEAVYKGLTAEPIESVPAQPPEPDDSFDQPDYFSIDSPSIADAPLATVSPIGGDGLDIPSIEDNQMLHRAPSIEHSTPSSASLGLAAVTNTEQADQLPESPDGFEMASASSSALEGDDAGFEADALESELASLRGLVARLANERQPDTPVLFEVSEVDDLDEVRIDDGLESDNGDEVIEFASPAAVASDDDDGLSADLEAAHHELYLTRADLTIARQEREEAQRLQSEALKHQVQLEKELATVRERKAELEGELTSSQAKAISVEERFARIETQLTEVDREREVVKAQLETMTLERNQIRDERSALRSERNELRTQLEEISKKTGGADVVELVDEHRVTKAELESTSRELARIITQAEQYDEQLKTFTAENKTLKSERIDLRARLGELETSLEVTTTQYDALKIDAERGASELGATRAERDGLQTQLGELQASLSEVLDEQVESRQRNDVDRRQLNELRVEHDVVLSRLSDVERSEQDARNRANGLTIERDDLLAGRDELLEERGQLRGELAAAASERGTALERLAEIEAKLPPLETELQMERRQREELANRLLELDDMADRTAAEQMGLVEERDALAAAVEQFEAEREDVEQYRRERDELAAELANTRTAHDAEIEALRLDLEAAAQDTEQMASARSGVEQRASELDEELASLRAKLGDVEAERDQAKALVAEADEVRSELEAREGELVELRTVADEMRRDLDEANVSAQVKESELRTVLGARTADASEIERLKTSLAESMVRADSEVEDQARALAAREAELEEREAEIAAMRTELEAVRSVMAESEDESAAAVTATNEQLAESTALVDQLRAELAEVRVELASAVAELEASGSTPGADSLAPVADGLGIPDSVADEDDDDELDSTAADVRSALRGPSVLDTIADGLPPVPTPTALLPDDDVVPAAEAEPFEAVVAAVPAPRPAPELDPEPFDDAIVDVFEAPESIAATEAEPVAAVSDPEVDDELDEVSELIARKMSTFSPDELSAAGPTTDENLDLVAEMAQGPDDGADADIDGSLAVSSTPPSILGDAPETFRLPERTDLGVSRSGSPKRRRIEIPGDIMDDEVAAARYVVSSPDVVLLVDGDSVAQMGWPKLPVAQQRDALVTYLADLSANSGAAPDVVFDGRIGDGDSLPASRAVRIRLSTPPTPPTAALDELVDAYPEQWPIALVTDNVDLASTAGERGAAVLNNGQLLDLFIAE